MGFFVKKNPYLEIMFFAVFLLMGCRVKSIGINWGTQATHPLPPGIVVRLLRDNGFQKVKLFEADSAVLNALSGSRIQVMVGIPNDMLPSIATSVSAAQNWVRRNVSAYISSISVDIRYIAVGNEPFLQTYNGTYNSLVLPALQNIQAAVISAGLGNRVAVTVPLNADVYRSSTSMPSTGNFRVDIHDIMVQIATFLSTNNAPFLVNIYPFISLYDDRSFPVDYAFFGAYSNPIIDNGRTYNNVFDANHDTLVWALQNNGFSNMSIIVGEIGWPTDGDINANPINAQRFNQGFMNHVSGGTPMRPGPIDAYLFSLIDEDAKSIQPGNFERHWGLFYYDGTAKYNLSLSSNSRQLVPAQGVQYQRRRWCVFSSSANLQNTQVDPSVSYACSHADCTSLGYGTSCGNLDAAGNISYAFNSYYQINNQLASACQFSNLAVVTETEPSAGTCRFNIMIQTQTAGTGSLSSNLLWVLLLQSLLVARSIL